MARKKEGCGRPCPKRKEWRRYPYFVWLIVKHYFIFWFLWLPYILWECVKDGKPWLIPVIGFFHVLYSPLMVILEADKEFKRTQT